MTNKKIAIIGAGLAGCALAYELSLYNVFDVEIFDQNSRIASEASGNYAGIIAPNLTSDNSHSDQFHTAGFSLLTQFIEKYRSRLEICNYGVMQILSTERDLQRYQKIFNTRDIPKNLAKLINSSESSELLEVGVSSAAVYYPNAVSLVPESLCKLWLDLSNTKLNINSKLLNVLKIKNNQWQLEFEGFLKDSDIVIFSGSYSLFKKISYLRDIPVYPSHGQLTVVKNWVDIKKTVMGNGYIIPNYKNNYQVIGATFRNNSDSSLEIRKEDDVFNLSQIKTTFVDLNIHDANIISSRVATRCVTSDHIPIVGKLVDFVKFKELFYKPLSKGYPKSKVPKVQYEDGLYLASGFGSKGLCSSLLSAKIITAQIMGQHNVVSDRLLDALSPKRFWIRNFKKNESYFLDHYSFCYVVFVRLKFLYAMVNLLLRIYSHRQSYKLLGFSFA